MVTYFWVTPTRTGRFDVLCEQLCGMAHFAMRGRVVVDEASAFETWLSKGATYAQTRARPAPNVAAGQTLYTVCSACHGAQAQGNPALNAPKLSQQAPWYLVRQLQNFKQGVRGADNRDIYAKAMVPMAATLADDAAIADVVAYIHSLPEEAPRATLVGDPAKGKSLYATCAPCHGAAGEGVWTTHAPRLAHMSDWYLARQLRNFRQGIRGSHPQDFYGAEMSLISQVLPDDQAVNDLLAYIRTFGHTPGDARVADAR
jgi:cytochrome c oxidase subunit 2